MTSISGMVGQEIFLGGTYLDLALNSSGTLGSRSTAPTGFVTDAVNGYIRLGMVGDTDGFGTGKAATRDAMLAGTPVESFSLGYEIGGTRYVKTNSERAGTVQITGGQTTNLSESGTAAAGWTGTTTEKVKVNQVFSLSDDAKYVKVEITLTNLSSAALSNLRYMRSIDPDHGASFNTNNKILEQGGDSTGGALIAAYASGTSTPLFYYTADERARVSTYGFENKDPYAAAAYDSAKGVGYTLSGDTAINIDFVLGSLKAGASTTITFYMGITNDLAATVKAINAAAAGSANTNHAPELVSDTATVTAGASVSGNVLSNDKDADGDALTASLKAGPSHGTVTLAADGSYKYVAASGYAGSDSFTYTVSDGKTTSSSTVTLTVQTPPKAPGPLDGANVTDGSACTNDVYTATIGQDVFYFDLAAKSGADKIVGFGANDLLVTSAKIYDGNGDGIIALSGGKVAIDAPKGTDTVTLSAVSNLRLLGSDENGNFVYADASVRPKGALEGGLGADVLKGDATDAKSQLFFFDNGLGLGLGLDKVTNFGAKDVIVTTSALKVDSSGRVVLSADGAISLAGSARTYDQGALTVTDLKGAAVTKLEYDGSVLLSGVKYYLYSTAGSAIGLDVLT